MLVPTRIESLPYAFTQELDLGATSTMLYGNTLIPYMKLSPALPGKLDTTTKRFRIEGQMNGGSSIFPMAVSETYYRQFTGNTPEDTLGISSWGKTIPAYGKKMQKPVQFGTMPLPPAKVFFVSGFDDFYKDENILGLTGNAFFLNDIIAIDFKNDRFGILK